MQHGLANLINRKPVPVAVIPTCPFGQAGAIFANLYDFGINYQNQTKAWLVIYQDFFVDFLNLSYFGINKTKYAKDHHISNIQPSGRRGHEFLYFSIQ
jgi:hypothetical protein